eukprot:SM000046S16414  [mRNA]  locus=s46:487937:488949:+ [translate_table: standard]
MQRSQWPPSAASSARPDAAHRISTTWWPAPGPTAVPPPAIPQQGLQSAAVENVNAPESGGVEDQFLQEVGREEEDAINGEGSEEDVELELTEEWVRFFAEADARRRARKAERRREARAGRASRRRPECQPVGTLQSEPEALPPMAES